MHHERRIRDRLNVMGVENFLPVQKVVRQWSDRRKAIESVVIPMIIFVRVSREERNRVLEVPAVQHYLVLPGERQPAVIPDEQMDNFRFMLDSSEDEVRIINGLLTPGERVRVIKGSLKGLEGELLKNGDKPRIAIRIVQLGYATVELNASFVEKIS